MKYQLFLELIEIHVQLRILHLRMENLLKERGSLSQEYIDTNFIRLQYEGREAKIVWQLADLSYKQWT